MDFNYEAYKRACAAQRERNKPLLDEFRDSLIASGLTPKTVNQHVSNIDFYLNEYLLREEALGIEEGCRHADDFLGYFFIAKCLWSTPRSIKGNIVSLKKFYKLMNDTGRISKGDYQELLEEIAESKDTWLDDCARFNRGEHDWHWVMREMRKREDAQRTEMPRPL